MLQSMGSQRVGLDLAPEQQQQVLFPKSKSHTWLTFTDIFFFLKIYHNMFTEQTFLKGVFCFVWLEDKGLGI